LAILPALPAQAIIDQVAGVLDFYVQHLNPSDERGIVCVRKWPSYVPEHYPASSKVMQPYFAYVNKMAPFISPTVLEAYKAMAGGTGLAWKDFLVRCYINGDLI